MKRTLKSEDANVALAASYDGFAETGGITTLLHLLWRELERAGQKPKLVKGLWPKLAPQLVVLGCSSPWSYLQMIRHRLRYGAGATRWIPCFHPATHVRHPKKASAAQVAIKIAQRIGINVLAQSIQEKNLLDSGRCDVISLGFTHTCAVEAVNWDGQREIDLVFLGRPTIQKGWPIFIELCRRSELSCQAFIPHTPSETIQIPTNLKIHIGVSDDDVRKGLRRSKILILPADYESFGFAQAEAHNHGCCVPVMGEWPLWIGTNELDWRGYTIDEVEWSIRKLAKDKQAQKKLWERQHAEWTSRQERLAPIWP